MLEEFQRLNDSEITTRNYLRVVGDFAKYFGESRQARPQPTSNSVLAREPVEGNRAIIRDPQSRCGPHIFPSSASNFGPVGYENTWTLRNPPSRRTPPPQYISIAADKFIVFRSSLHATSRGIDTQNGSNVLLNHIFGTRAEVA